MRARLAQSKLAAMPSAVQPILNSRERPMSTSSKTPSPSNRRRGPMPRRSLTARSCGMTPLGAVVRGLVAGAAGHRRHGRSALRQVSPRSRRGTLRAVGVLVGRGQLGAGARAGAGGQAAGGGPVRARAAAAAGPAGQQHHSLGLRDLRRCAVRDRRRLVARHPASGTGCRLAPACGRRDTSILPAAKLYQPIWKYDRVTLTKDLSAHLVYGLGTATTLRLLAGTTGAAS